jgi:hypothetical protein
MGFKYVSIADVRVAIVVVGLFGFRCALADPPTLIPLARGTLSAAAV